LLLFVKVRAIDAYAALSGDSWPFTPESDFDANSCQVVVPVSAVLFAVEDIKVPALSYQLIFAATDPVLLESFILNQPVNLYLVAGFTGTPYKTLSAEVEGKLRTGEVLCP